MTCRPSARRTQLAELAGHLALQVVGSRQRRVLYFTHGWPYRFVQGLGSSPVDQAALIGEFRRDYESFKKLCEVPRPPAALERLLGRSCCHCTLVKQWVAALEHNVWVWTSQVEALAKQMVSGVIGTQVIEDMFAVQKNATRVRGSRRARKPQASMGLALARGVIDKRHHYNLVESTIPIPRRTLRLDKPNFLTKEGECSIDLSNVATTSQRASYCSPGVENLGLAASDLTVLRAADLQGMACQAGRLDLVTFCNASHRLIFRMPQGLGQPEGWHVGLAHFVGSACLAWPLNIEPVPKCGNSEIATLRGDLSRPILITVFSWASIVARTVVWKPWSAQVSEFPLAVGEWRPVIRLCITSPEMPLAELAAKQCFWALDRTALRMIGDHLSISLNPSGDLFETLMAMVQGILGASEAECMAIVAKRLVQGSGQHDITEEFLQIDEAAKVLQQEDEQVLRHEQKQQHDEHRGCEGNIQGGVQGQERYHQCSGGGVEASRRIAQAGRRQQRLNDRPVRRPSGEVGRPSTEGF